MIDAMVNVMLGVVLLAVLGGALVWAGPRGMENHERRMYRHLEAGQADDVRGWLAGTGAAGISDELQPVYSIVESE